MSVTKFYINLYDRDGRSLGAVELEPRLVTELPSKGSRVGELVFNLADSRVYYWNGSEWAILGTPKLSELLETEIVSPSDQQMLIYDASKEKWVNTDPNVTIVGDEVLRGADNRTLTDLYNHLQYLGAHRLQAKKYDSGSITVAAGTKQDLLSVSGIGRFLKQIYVSMSGSSYSNSRFHVFADGVGAMGVEVDVFPGPAILNAMGWGSTGYHSDGIFACRVTEWDTTNNIYKAHGYKQPELVFRNTLESDYNNIDTANDVTIQQVIIYELFVASKQALMVIPEYISARLLRKLVDKRASAIEVHTVGQFEKEEEIPYGEFVGTKREHHLTELARRKPLTYVIITYPENVELEKILGRFKPKKILHDNIL